MLSFNPDDLPELMAQGYVVSQTHPTLPLRIYNYGAKTQYERNWNAATLACRGLVLDAEGVPVGRPLGKFFNLAEHQGTTLPDGTPEVYEKLDGSMILLFFYGASWLVSSRGSFISEQAVKATELLANYDLEKLDRDYSYMLEVIYPTNRIVVDYGAVERLVMLAGIHTQTGEELRLEEIDWADRAQIYAATSLPDWIKSLKPGELVNQEGFILRWPNGFRAKYKLDEYVRLHRILTRIQAKDIWECLSCGQDLDRFLESVPDEFYNWVKGVRVDLEAQYGAIERQCREVFKDLGDRKSTAAYFQTQRYAKVLFLMLDGRDYASVIWREIKPGFERPFRVDPDI
jgi:hypothetical protein